MTTKPKAKKFRIRRSGSLAAGSRDGGQGQTPSETGADGQSPAAQRPTSGAVDSPRMVSAETEINAIRQEGLTGRQLRMARRVAQKHGLAVTSDFDAVRQLRAKGIDPFQRANIIELVVPEDLATEEAAAQMGRAQQGQPGQQGARQRAQLPQTTPGGRGNAGQLPQKAQVGQIAVHGGGMEDPANRRASEIRRIQIDIAKRRRRKLAALFARLAAFILLTTALVGYYFYNVATPMYATKTEFVIQQAEGATGGLGGLFQGTSMATQQDSITVQSHLLSREVMVRLIEEEGFKEHFSSDAIDPLQRLAPDATNEDAYNLYGDFVIIGYDPTEGLVRMEVIAATPEASQRFAEALVGFAEERVNNLTQRVREDQMSGARQSYEEAEAKRQEALEELVAVQSAAARIDPIAESGALLSRITALETQRDDLELELQSLLDNRRPNEARVNATRSDIDRINDQIALLRGQMTQAGADGDALNEINARLRQAEENYAARVTQVQLALQQMETAQIEANRQVRYLSLGVRPIAPDEPTYPRKFENTILAFFVFSGIYLMISLTASVLREQVSS